MIRLFIVCGFLLAGGSALVCPKCHLVENIQECLQNNETCNEFEDVCIGMMQEWKITMHCGTTARCRYDEMQSTTDCRGDHSFKPTDTCTTCCTGSVCTQRLHSLQRGLDARANVLHCPVCTGVTDPQQCMQNTLPCNQDAVTCEITIKGQLFSSQCASKKLCTMDNDIYCCNDHKCLSQVLATSPIMPQATGSGQAECKDDTLHPCKTSLTACIGSFKDSCRLTCGECVPTSNAVIQTKANQCPRCHHAQNVQECLNQMETCHRPDDVCMIDVSHWHIHSTCTSRQMCESERDRHSDVNCTGGEAFGPRDRCYACCTGDECLNTLPQVQKGFDVITSALHCPLCDNVNDVQSCLQNFAPCSGNHDTCEIYRKDGLFTSQCSSRRRCEFRSDYLASAQECYGKSGDCTVCCHDHTCIDTMFGVTTTPSPLNPGMTTPQMSLLACKDKELFPCHKTEEDGACSDDQFAHEFCPQTCGVCQNTTPATSSDCKDSDFFPCTMAVAATCGDPDLAVSLCAKTCGKCGSNAMVTTTPLPITTAIPIEHQHPTLKCPSCRRYRDIEHCTDRLTTCHSDHDVCMGTLRHWRFTMECGFSQFCKFKQNQGYSSNCTDGHTFGPTDECTVCCTGDECTKDIGMIKTSLNNVVNVLHCPTCNHTMTPEECLKNTVACSPDSDSCLITRTSEGYTAGCNHHHWMCRDHTEECEPTSTGDCHTCCTDEECVKKTLLKPVPVCKDSEFFPCAFALDATCRDPDLAASLCAKSCGICGSPQAVTTPVPTTTPIPKENQHPTLKCPWCRRLGDIEHCSDTLLTCRSDHDVCIGTFRDWRFSMECGFSQVCKFKQEQPYSSNCTDGHTFGPKDECTVCCTGDECTRDIGIIKTSLNNVVNVLHCPTCNHTMTPEECLKNTKACSPDSDSCLITRTSEGYTAGCYNHHRICHDHSEECDPSETGDCHTCCRDQDCILKTLAKATPTQTPTTGQPVPCHDDKTFPCLSAKDSICSDPDFSTVTCPATCGHCALLTPSTTTPIPKPCVDDPGFPCVANKDYICKDADLSQNSCPKTCNKC